MYSYDSVWSPWFGPMWQTEFRLPNMGGHNSSITVDAWENGVLTLSCPGLVVKLKTFFLIWLLAVNTKELDFCFSDT